MFDKVLKLLNDFTEKVCTGILIFLIIEITYVVIMRKFFNATPSWGEVLARLCVVYVCFLGICAGVRNDFHIRITIFDSWFPEKVIRVLDYFYLIVAVVFSLFLMIYGIDMVNLGTKSIISGLNIKTSWQMLCIPIGGFLCLCQVVYRWRQMGR